MNERIINKSGNKNCILCGNKNPSWGCLPFAILACTKCAGGIRELGTSACTVKSLLLDEVDDDFLHPFITGSNSLFLDWYAKKSKEDLKPAFFKTALAKEYAKDLKEGKIKEKTITSAPTLKNTPLDQTKKTQRKSKLKFLTENDAGSDEEPEKQEEKQEERQEEILKKKTIRRVPGRIQTDDASAISRLGMFKNVKDMTKQTEESTLAKQTGRNNSRVITDDPQNETKQEIVKGKNFIGSADAPKETVTDRLKNSLEKGKKTLLNTFKK
ncbi:hypothetical protein NEAUS03_2289 [Nematocida ausubeli]|nr:hypothetical protein NEAUS03_2289 [Nematocida ausubeli]